MRRQIEIFKMEYSGKQLQIIESAEQLFASKGYDATSVRDIAQEASVNIAMISYYFGSKEKLLHAVFEKRTANLRLKIENLLQDATITPWQKINIVIDDYIEKMFQQQQFHKIMVREQLLDKNNEVASLIHETKKRNLNIVKQLIQEGQKSGDFKKNVDIPMMMVTLTGVCVHLIATQHFYKEMNNLGDISEMELQKILKKKVSQHLKNIFKSILSYEA